VYCRDVFSEQVDLVYDIELKRVEQGSKIIEKKNDQKKVNGYKTISKKYRAVI